MLAFAILAPIKSFAQSYQSILRNTSWNILLPNLSNDSLALGNDTILNGTEYKKLQSKKYANFYIREDTINQKVWIKYADSAEVLVYDFALQVGDSITMTGFWGTSLINQTKFKIDSITIDSFEGVARRVWHLNPFSFTWIEGVGSTYGLLATFSPGLWFTTNPPCSYPINYYLLCAHQGAKLNFLNKCIKSCYFPGVGIDKMPENEKPPFNCYPNPASDQITIEVTDFSDHNLRFVLLDATGRAVSNGMVGDKIQISLHGLQNGVYTLSISSDTFSAVKKIIKL